MKFLTRSRAVKLAWIVILGALIFSIATGMSVLWVDVPIALVALIFLVCLGLR